MSFKVKLIERDFDDKAIYEAYYYLGSAKVKALEYRKNKVERAIADTKLVLEHKEYIREEILNVIDTEDSNFVKAKDVRELLEACYKELGISIVPSGTQIYYFIRPCELFAVTAPIRGYKYTPKYLRQSVVKSLNENKLYEGMALAQYESRYKEKAKKAFALTDYFYVLDFNYIDWESAIAQIEDGFNLYYAVN